jgi:hypothetical protein
MKLKLSPPKNVIWIICLILGIVALLLHFNIIKGYTDYAFWLAIIAAAVMLIATYFKGL